MDRKAQRYTVWLPVRIPELEAGMAVSHNVSGRGMLVVTATTLEVGANVHVVVNLPPEGVEERELTGKVVRVEANEEDPEGLWPHRVAVEFDEPSAEIERTLTQLVEAGIAKVQR